MFEVYFGSVTFIFVHDSPSSSDFSRDASPSSVWPRIYIALSVVWPLMVLNDASNLREASSLIGAEVHVTESCNT